jgi:phage-related protein (TIGR01555 family)
MIFKLLCDLFLLRKQDKPEVKNEDYDPLDLTGSFDANEVRAKYINDNAIQRSPPKSSASDSVMDNAMDSCSGASSQYQASFDNANPHLLAYYIASSSFIGYYACAIIAQHWLVSKGCGMKADDAVKKGWDISADDGAGLSTKQIKAIGVLDKKYRLKYNMREGVKYRNIFGIRHLLFKNTDPNFDYEKPFNADSFSGGKYAGISQIDPYWVTPVFDDNDLNDPTSIGFYEPTYWQINGKKYHKSHFVILVGDEVSDYLKPTYRYGGVPLTQKVYERVYASERTANEGPQLAMTKRLQVRKTDLAKAQAHREQFERNLKTANDFKDNYGVTVIGKEEDINQLETSLADLDNVIMTQYQLVCSEFGIPATKLLGTSPKGFSTGDTDNDSYLEDVEAIQGNEMNEIAQAHYARLIPSSLLMDFGVDELELELVWRPLKIQSEVDISTARANNASADAALFNTGAVDNIDIRQKLANTAGSGYTGLKMPDEIIEDD